MPPPSGLPADADIGYRNGESGRHTGTPPVTAVSNRPTPPDVSVLIPCRNYGRYLAETLENLTQQTLSAWECLIIDYGSTDSTVSVVERAARTDPRFRLITIGSHR